MIIERRLSLGGSDTFLLDTGLPNMAGDRSSPIVCLHGSGSSSGVFAKQLVSAASREHRLIAIDLPGHGRSGDAADPGSEYTLCGLADRVEAVLDRLQIRHAAVVGWSLGGHVGIELLARGRLSGLLLCGAAPVAPGLIGMLRGFQPSFDILLASKETYSVADARRFEALCFGSASHPSFAEAIQRTDGRLRTVFPKSLLRAESGSQRDTVLRACVPVGFVNGELDPFVRLGFIDGLKVRVPFGRGACVIARAGHAPFWTHPDEFNALLAQFMDLVEDAILASNGLNLKQAAGGNP